MPLAQMRWGHLFAFSSSRQIARGTVTVEIANRDIVADISLFSFDNDDDDASAFAHVHQIVSKGGGTETFDRGTPTVFRTNVTRVTFLLDAQNTFAQARFMIYDWFV